MTENWMFIKNVAAFRSIEVNLKDKKTLLGQKQENNKEFDVNDMI